MSLDMSPTSIPSNAALATALAIYPLITRLALPANATPERFILTRETISAIHSALISLASATELYRQREKWFPREDNQTSPSSSSSDTGNTSSQHRVRPSSSIIDAQSPVANALIAWECGYLFADFAILVLGSRRFRSQSHSNSKSVLARSVNWRILGWHHLGIGIGLALYHIHGLRGPTRGVMVMLIMLLMNITTPFGTLYWYLAKFKPQKRQLIAATNAAYLSTYAVFRVYLMYWAHHVYALSINQPMWDAYAGTPPLCRLGVATITTTNTIWLVTGVQKFIGKHLPVLMGTSKT